MLDRHENGGRRQQTDQLKCTKQITRKPKAEDDDKFNTARYSQGFRLLCCVAYVEKFATQSSMLQDVVEVEEKKALGRDRGRSSTHKRPGHATAYILSLSATGAGGRGAMNIESGDGTSLEVTSQAWVAGVSNPVGHRR